MTPQQEDKLIARVEATIEKKVNGRIDSFRLEMREALKEQNKAIQPAIDAIADWNSGTRVIKWVFGVFMAIGAGWLLILKIIEKTR